MLPELVSTSSQGQIHAESEIEGNRHLNSVRSKGLPQVHNLPCSSNEVQSISTAFKRWQNSAPTLHQYRPDEIEVVIHRRTGKVDRVKRSQDCTKLENSATSDLTMLHKDNNKQEKFYPPEIQFSEHRLSQFNDSNEGNRSPLRLSDDHISTEDRNESFISSLDDRSNASYIDEDDEDEDLTDCYKCRLLKQKLDETTEQVNARQNLIVALTSLNNDQVEVGRKLRNEIKELNQRLINTELIYSQNIKTIRDSLQLVTKQNQSSQNRTSQYSTDELKLSQLIEKSRTAFATERPERGDPDGMDSTTVKDTSLGKIQRALTNMSKHLDSSDAKVE